MKNTIAALIFVVVTAAAFAQTATDTPAQPKLSEPQTTSDPSSEYLGIRPQFSTFTLIGLINTRTKDQSHTVVVDMLIQYDLNDNVAQAELTGRVHQLRDFTRNFFASKHYTDLAPENEEMLKREIREILNDIYLDAAIVRGILFARLDVMEL